MISIRRCPGTASRAPSESTTTTGSDASHYIAGTRRRRSATIRVPRYSDKCACRDPWTCSHDGNAMSEHDVDGYRAAAQHLLDAGLAPAPNVPALRAMWRRGNEERRLARTISERWEVAA